MSIFDEVHHQNLKLPTFDLKPPSSSNLSGSTLFDKLIFREEVQKACFEYFYSGQVVLFSLALTFTTN